MLQPLDNSWAFCPGKSCSPSSAATDMQCHIIHNDVLMRCLSKNQTDDSLMVQSSGLFGGWGHAIQIVWCPHECRDLRACASVYVYLHLCLDLSQRSKTLTFSYGANLKKVSIRTSVCGYSSSLLSELQPWFSCWWHNLKFTLLCTYVAPFH